MQPIYVIRRGENLVLSFEANPILALYAKKIEGMRYKKKENIWVCPTSQEHFVKSFGEFFKKRGIAEGLVYIDSIEDIHHNFADHMPAMELPEGAPFRPYDYQLKGIRYIVEKKRTFVADDMGLGKTFESVCACWTAKSYPVLVVCPLAMKETWKREFMQWTQKNALVIDDAHRYDWWRYVEAGSYSVVIVNYESIRKYFVERVRNSRYVKKNVVLEPHVAMFRTVIVDECHHCKEPKNQSSVFLEAICEGKEYVFMLSGTPIVLSNIDLIEQLRIMGRLDDFGGEKEYRKRYCRGKTKSSNMVELNTRLWNTCFFRRDKSLVLKELPEKTRQFLYVDITNRSEYALAERDLYFFLRNYKKLSNKRVKKAMRGEMMVRISYLRQIAAVGKMKVAVPFIHDCIDGGGKLIVFVFHKTIVDELRKYFPDLLTITGSDSAREKQNAIDSFQNDPNRKLIVVNYRSGGCGVTLTAASRELFIELPWTCSDCDQSEARAHRNGQKNAVNCYYLIGKDTIDETIWKVIEEEREISKTVIGARDDTEVSNVDKVIDLIDL